ncbi:MAG: AMIN domain-containing protein [Thermodesulfobacteria bacterium]|nr:AMIN domain-containing protein [Thermodesulfobacteriota bacterium]
MKFRLSVNISTNFRRLFWLFLLGLVLNLALPLPASSLTEAERAYQQAEKELQRFAASRQKLRYRRHWLKVIARFKNIYRRYPESRVAPRALYRVGRLYEELYGYSGRKADLYAALKYYELLWEKYPKSSHARLALKRAIVIYERKLRSPVKALALKKKLKRLAGMRERSPTVARQAKKNPPPKRSTQAVSVAEKKTSSGEKKSASKLLAVKIGGTIKQIRYWSSKDYSRVVLDLSRKVSYSPHVLKASKEKPPRLYVDIKPARISPYLKPVIPIKDGLLKQIRFGQYRKDTVRVVLDLASLTDYRVFFLDEPARLVIDLIGKGFSEKPACPAPPKIINGEISLAQQLGLCIRRVVIDPGHGGRDPGCRNRRLKEKHIVLRVSKLLAQKLRAKLGCEVVLTRTKDVFIPLEQRTAIANMKRADLFVSIHVNSSPRRRAYGIETYYLNFASDEEAMRVAALENAASTHSLSELQDLLKGILLNTKLEESHRLAEAVQRNLVKTLRRRYRPVKDRGVRTAPFVVLIGTRMPAVLVEIGFLSNPMEEKRLRDPKYLDLVAEGIARGITAYVKKMKLSAR